MKLTFHAKLVLAAAFLVAGYAMALHAIAGELYDKGGYPEILSFQGEWIGMAILAIGLVLNAVWFWHLQRK
ncbi:TPA: hypothetical protein HA274_03720 [Candidatus Bathyarchaeota archaeon]|nr:hypothetical protein [Candidatus Bathyarchaeota archaeon]